ncbi:type II toxin-antitoxin system HicA family toxin [Variovorax saccharolyticus]|uniref:type II toxin-antitoxin system HicA family toxin n=1 Tax=Variovorax saccharolyticus TaxID=3053516 RepID=UPI00336A4E61
MGRRRPARLAEDREAAARHRRHGAATADRDAAAEALSPPAKAYQEFKHASKPGRVTVAGKPSADLAPGTLNSIRKQADLKS